MKILVADDTRVVRAILTDMMADWGYEIMEAADGEQALNILLSEDPPRIAILDWIMPRMDGVDVCRELVKREDKLIYKILLTARSQREDMVFALDSGAHDFIPKPVHPEELRSRVAVGRRLVDSDDKLQDYAHRMEALAQERAHKLLEAEHQARTDPLTGLFNRRYFSELAEAKFKLANDGDTALSVLMLDLDHFKKVNDTYGHAAGDAILKQFATLLEYSIRHSDIPGRLGGEEFATLLLGADQETGMLIAENIRAGMERARIPYKDKVIQVTVSIGLATLRQESQNGHQDGDGETLTSITSIKAMLEAADKALYKAKNTGRNKVVAAP